MEETNDKEITNLELLESINRSFTNIEKKMVTKEDFEAFKFESTTHFKNLESDLKTFKLETSIHFNNIESDLKGIKKDILDNTETQSTETSDLNDTVMLHDKRLEKLENKVFA